LLERAVLDFLDEQHGPSLRQGSDYRIPITLPDNPLRGSPDGLVVDADGEIIEGREAKTAVGRIAALYGEPGSDEVPQDHAIQCHAYMAITGALWWRIGLLTSAGGFTFASYLIQRDESICEAILARCREWWNAHVIGDAEPHMTDVERGDRAASLFPVPLDKWLEADPATDAEIRTGREQFLLLEDLESQVDVAEADFAAFEGRMKALIGKYSGIRSSVGSIEFKALRTGRKLRYRWNEEE
jgi:predicted phage-related endonuclease